MATLFYKAVTGLSNIKRFPSYRMLNQYSCAEHSYRVAMLSMIIVDEYNLNPKNTMKIDKAETLTKALTHDLEEYLLNDISSPVKKYPGLRDLLREASLKLMQDEILDKDLINRNYYLKMWKEDKDDVSGQVIEIADKLEALMAASEELKVGNTTLRDAFQNLRNWFDSEIGKSLTNKFPVTKKLIASADEVR